MKTESEQVHLRRVSHWKLYFLVLVIAFVVVLVFSLNIGYSPIPFSDILAILAKQVPILGNLVDSSGITKTAEVIILQIRLPRVICGALVGAALATAGVTYQGIFRNTMADPYVIGASTGASLDKILSLIIFLEILILSLFSNTGSIP